MATSTVATSQAAGVASFATGVITSDGGIATVTIGFKARYIKVVNVTDVITWEKMEGMGATITEKRVTGGTTTMDTGTAITISDRSFAISATAAGSAKSLVWIAFG